MGEAFLVKAGTGLAKDPLDDVIIAEGRCSILITLTDSEGNIAANTAINCKDGSSWYNYTTNEKGMVLFQCNSGSANIIANNWIGGVRVFDQGPLTMNFDAPVGTKFHQTINLAKITSYNSTQSASGIFRVTDTVKNINITGGGGGGAGSYWYDPYGTGWKMQTYAGGGGGGGARNFSDSFTVARNQNYTLTVGAGGAASATGGTTSAFGLSSLGGGGASLYTGGAGGSGLYAGGTGGSGQWEIVDGGSANCTSATAGTNGAGGGGGGGQQQFANTSGASTGGGYGGGWNIAGGSGTAGTGGGGGGAGWPAAISNSEGYFVGYELRAGGTGGSGRIEFEMV